MELKLKEIAKIVEGKIEGNENILIKGVAGLLEAKKEEISFLSDTKYLPQLKKTKAGAVIVPENVSLAGKNLVKVKNSYFAFLKILRLVEEEKKYRPKGIHPTTVIGERVSLGENVAIGAYSVIGEGVTIGDGTVIHSHCYLGRGSKIGKNSLIYPRVCILERISIGERTIIHSGTVIGSDGFGFLTLRKKHRKIPQVGTVEIGDDVEIGANCTIDRATVDKTKIGRGTKIDNLVQIGHNVGIGENCIIAAQVGIAGSTKIGNNVVFGGQAGVTDHISIGDNVRVAGRAGVTTSIPAGVTVSGFPAGEHRKMLKIQALVEKLPKFYADLKNLKKRKSV